MDKYMITYSDNGRLQSSTMCDNMKELQSRNVNLGKSDTKEYIPHNSVYMKLKTRQNYGIGSQNTGES